MEFKTKTSTFTQAKMLGEDDDDGTFSGIIATHGNIDSWGDIGQPGMFERTLAEWAAKERNIPVLWAHDIHTPPIGVVEEAREVTAGELDFDHPAGLFAKARLFIAEHPLAAQVYVGMKARAQHEFSYGYDEVKTDPVMVDDFEANGLFDVELYEISPVFQGANSRTATIDVKAKGEDLDKPSLMVPDPNLINRLRLL